RPPTEQVGRNRGLPRSRRDDAREHRPHRREACLTFDNQNVVGEQQPNQAESTAPGRLIPYRVVVDGVPVFWLEVPAPLRAMLVFRVGQVDETLPTHGITHLVEHLAMYPLMQNLEAANRINARVEPFRTRFMASGTPEEIATFLADVTTSLTNLPLDRLENEKKVLRRVTAGFCSRCWARAAAPSPSVRGYWTAGFASVSDTSSRWPTRSTPATSASTASWLRSPPSPTRSHPARARPLGRWLNLREVSPKAGRQPKSFPRCSRRGGV